MVLARFRKEPCIYGQLAYRSPDLSPQPCRRRIVLGNSSSSPSRVLRHFFPPPLLHSILLLLDRARSLARALEFDIWPRHDKGRLGRLCFSSARRLIPPVKPSTSLKNSAKPRKDVIFNRVKIVEIIPTRNRPSFGKSFLFYYRSLLKSSLKLEYRTTRRLFLRV